MMSTWTPATTKPTRKQYVVGCVREEYLNARWRWSEPLVYRWTGRTFVAVGIEEVEAPDVWAPLPALPVVKTPGRVQERIDRQREANRLRSQASRLLAERA
jgi:hypothetical protein